MNPQQKAKVKQQVQAWLKTKDYQKGLEILISHRPRMMRTFSGREYRYASKLEYELKKLAGIDHLSALAKPSQSTLPKPQPTKPTTQQPNKPVSTHSSAGKPNPETLNLNPETFNLKPETPSPEPEAFKLSSAHKNLDAIPPEIETVAREHSRLFTVRSQLAQQREKLGDSNTGIVVKQRKALSEAIKMHSERIEQLFRAHQAFLQKGIVPDLSELFPVPPENPGEDQLADPTQLAEERKKLLSANQRDRTWLTYNNAKKQKVPNPMPKGDRRNEIEHRMAERTLRIKQIDAITKSV